MTTAAPALTKAACLAAAGRAITVGLMRSASMSVEDAARAAYVPTGPSIEELEALISARRRAAAQRRAAA